jgi:hypothetical protein
MMAEKKLADRLRECAEEVMEFPHPSHCDHLHDAAKLMIEAAAEVDASRPAPAQAPLTETYVQPVPDYCDRITWRNRYYSLPLETPAAKEGVASPAIEDVFARYADAGYSLALVFDDDGRWAVSDSGSQPLPDTDEGHTTPTTIGSYVKPEQWKPSVREAVAFYVASHPLDTDPAQGQREVVAPGAAPRGTDAQILKERELTASAIRGAMAFGYQGVNAPPESDHWLAEFWEIGRKQRELERPSEAAGAAQPVAIYHGGGVDCEEHGHHLEMLKLIPLGTKLYTSPTAAPEGWREAELADLEATLEAWGNAPSKGKDDSGLVQGLFLRALSAIRNLRAALNREVEPRTVRMPLKEEQIK